MISNALKDFSLRLATFLSLLSLALFPHSSDATPKGAASAIGSLPFEEYVLPREVIVTRRANQLTSRAINFLKEKNRENATVWVFFTDKGPSVQKRLNTELSQLAQTRSSRARRIKSERGQIVFADLPVSKKYLSRLLSLGVEIKAVSRWLNAVAVTTDYSTLDHLPSLPFVAEIRPTATFRRSIDSLGRESKTANDDDIPESVYKTAAGPEQTYGPSYDQITQIKAHIGHQRGYIGQGVVIAMLDTGYRKSHKAFAQAYADNRVLAEWDFINDDGNTANEGADRTDQWNHGTLTWSTAGGQVPGTLFGPAYGASFLLAKTEDLKGETIIEEYNWVEALEWADSMGADIISSSLGYILWYTYESLDGATAVTTVAANIAASLGIVVCNAMGNMGQSGSGSLIAPCDAHDILSVGAVNVLGNIASFSSRGPTFDGRIKPEVCARGVSTYCAYANSDEIYGSASGTSLSTPLVAGVVGQLISAYPTLPPLIIMQSIKETSSNSNTPDNNYGWGIIDLEKALAWSVDFSSNLEIADFPQTLDFGSLSQLEMSAWSWSFGDGNMSTAQNPSHAYAAPGIYDVSLTITTPYGDLTAARQNHIMLVADTVKVRSDSGFAGHELTISLDIVNSQPIQSIVAPLSFNTGLELTYDSVSRGARTTSFDSPALISFDLFDQKIAVQLSSDSAILAPGTGEILRLHFTIGDTVSSGRSGPLTITSFNGIDLSAVTPKAAFPPRFENGSAVVQSVIRGDANHDEIITIGDAVLLAKYFFQSGPAPFTIESGDANSDLSIDLGDAVFLVNYIFQDGPPPAS